MKIAVMGAGAIGSLFGAMLARSGCDVTLIGREAHVKAIVKRGLRVSGLEDYSIKVKATTGAIEADLFLLTVKSYDTEEAVKSISLGRNTLILTLQNGIGNEDIIAAIAGRDRVASGKTANGSTLIEPGHIRFTGKGETAIGELDGGITQRIKNIAEMFNRAGIKTSVSHDMQTKIWEKLIVNVGINAVTAITGLRNGEILKVPELRSLMCRVVEEAVFIASSSGISLSEDMVKRTAAVAEATGENMSSMLQDINRGRKTEIDAINGAIVKYGERLNIPTPVNQALTAVVKGIEWRKQVGSC